VGWGVVTVGGGEVGNKGEYDANTHVFVYRVLLTLYPNQLKVDQRP
jgi:hypothetical protein